tara:strand:- start:1975 stop:2484 length:510 start_codon:yes stop_codon:yes gene_type:complete
MNENKTSSACEYCIKYDCAILSPSRDSHYCRCNCHKPCDLSAIDTNSPVSIDSKKDSNESAQTLEKVLELRRKRRSTSKPRMVFQDYQKGECAILPISEKAQTVNYLEELDEAFPSIASLCISQAEEIERLRREKQTLLGALSDIGFSEDMTLDIAKKKAARIYSSLSQ